MDPKPATDPKRLGTGSRGRTTRTLRTTRRARTAAVAAVASVLTLSAFWAPPAVRAQEYDSTSVHPAAKEAIGKLWSPYCPGLMLEVCPSPGGAMLRDSSQAMAVRGMSADSIIERMLAEYGEEYRAQPRTEGVGGLAWYVPPAALAAGLAIVAGFLARRRRRTPTSPASAPSEADEARLRDAMAVLDAEERPDF